MSVAVRPFQPYVLYEGTGRPKLANLLTLSRLFAVPVILSLLAFDHAHMALEVYVLAVLTDGLDGFVARRTRTATAFGARLDAVVDNAFSLAILPFLLLAFPGIGQAHPLALAALFGVPILYLAVSWLWKHRLLMYHFQSAKLGAVLLFFAWPLISVTGWTGWVVLAALVVTASRIEQLVYMARGGLDLDAPHGFVAVEDVRVAATPRAVGRETTRRHALAPTASAAPTPLVWYAPTPEERGPVVSLPDPRHNAIGVPTGTYAPYRAFGLARRTLRADHLPRYFATEPTATIGPFPAWSEEGRIVTMDPFGHLAPIAFADRIATGCLVRPTIAITEGTLELPEIDAAIREGSLDADGTILREDGQIAVTKIAVEPVWYLPGLARRLCLQEADLRTALHETSGRAWPALVERPDLSVFLPPIGGHSVYLFGDPSRLGRLETEITCRIHDECNSSDVFGSTLCTCRPYLAFAVEEAIRQAQRGGVGVVVYSRKEGRSLGEVTKYLVYNARMRDVRGDRPEDYFDHTEAVAGTGDLREQMLSGDILHWLGIGRVDRWISMSNLKRDALVAQGIDIVRQVELPADRTPVHAHTEIDAKIAAGYFNGRRTV